MAPPTQTETIPKPANYYGSGSNRRGGGYDSGKLENKNGIIAVTGEEELAKYSYPQYIPEWDTKYNFPPLEEFEPKEPGLNADPSFPNLLKEGVEVTELTPKFGSEVKGIQLSKLSDQGKDELALFVAQRGVVAFRDQDLAKLSLDEVKKFGEYFGPLHVHPASAAPKGHPEIHLVHRAATTGRPKVFEDYISSVRWHSDVSYEKQPPSTTFLYLLDGPSSGGDTVFADQIEAYERLSDGFKSRLHGLKAYHSGYEQYQDAIKAGYHVRRAPVANVHPVVRTHPTLKKKALYINDQFTRSIVGFKKEESDVILNFLYDYVGKSIDLQARVKWAPGTVVVWDNRRAIHSALYDWDTNERRHLARLTPQGEIPYEE
ncbi:alpha-ketoglutarate-dependent sulfonate dioxygenase [Trichomonascus vanleenenianus]|uniref:TauD/TfdA dioxygenase family protein n=1 Tax=Trichomonascus vanleenenianus TaxID=2268995 RepID=UPI003EC966EA